MSYAYERYDRSLAIQTSRSERAAFIRRTYGHLAGAILAFVALEALLLQIPNIGDIVMGMVGNRIIWLLIIGAFIGVGYLADAWARSDVSPGLQYLGLGLYVVAQAVIFLPLLYVATFLVDDKQLVPTAGVLTLAVFGGLTLAVFMTRRDFSFLAPILSIGGFLALGLVIAFMFIGGSTFGLLIAFLMVALASGAILYQTSNIMYHYRTDQHVAAALALFASVATLFWYILYILMATSRR
jgi:FtsH-binding integral membrane protein